jgi:CDP-diacylglycerol--glycerol-3-phosphate 3-phosphatidyltransferase
MNLPNKLSLMRVIMVPLFVAVMVIPETVLPDVWSRILSAAIFILTAFTDFLDGMIARKFNMITDFGNFIDPLADKFMVFGAMLAILYKYDYLRDVFIWAALIVIFRELAITSMRLIISSSAGKVVAAAWLGKVKTVTQIVCIVVVLLEPVIIPQSSALYDMHLFSYITIAAMTVMTLWSGIDYMKTYWQFLDPTK